VLIIRRSKLYYTASGIITPCRWPSRAQVEMHGQKKNQSIYVDYSLSAEIDRSAGNPTPLIKKKVLCR